MQAAKSSPCCGPTLRSKTHGWSAGSIRSKPRTLVPTVAIVTENGQAGVLLVDSQQKPVFQSVELGNSSGDQTAILKGLEAGTRVFIDLPPWADSRD